MHKSVKIMCVSGTKQTEGKKYRDKHQKKTVHESKEIIKTRYLALVQVHKNKCCTYILKSTPYYNK